MKNVYFKKGISLIIILLFMFCFYPSSTGFKQDLKLLFFNDGNILYVGGSGPDNYTSIQRAINDAVDGDTVFVYDDSSPYYETSIVVDKSINLIGENRDTTVIDGKYKFHVNGLEITADSVNVSGFTIINSGCPCMCALAGIKIFSNYCTITNNNVSDDGNGIVLFSNNNIIDNNIISKNIDFGIGFSGDNNSVSGNNISNNYYCGIFLSGGNNNTISKNNFLNNEHHANFDILPFSRNQWKQNFWDKLRILPKPIFGILWWGEDLQFMIPWFQFDWHPALKPYDI